MQTVRLTMYDVEKGKLLRRTIYINPEHVVKAYESTFRYNDPDGDRVGVPSVRIDTDDIIPVHVEETLPEVMAKLGGETGQTYSIVGDAGVHVSGLTMGQASRLASILGSQFHIEEER